MTQSLHGKVVAALVTDGFEQVELTGPKKALEDAGATVRILSDKAGEVRGWNHHQPAEPSASTAHSKTPAWTTTTPCCCPAG